MAIEDLSSDAPDPADSFILRYLYRPQPGAVLYHYCSMEAFEAIIRTGNIRLSDINMMNDFAEMKWGYGVFAAAASRILAKRKDDSTLPRREFLDGINTHLSPTQLYIHPLIACFSKNPDVLSQWRGYADNGSGVSIGFNAENLVKTCATFLNCEYDFEEQIEQMEGRLIAAHSLGDEFSAQDHAMHLFGYLPALKNPAFREEAEVRAVHLLTVELSEDGVELVDVGGDAFGKKVGGGEVQFGIRKNGVVAFLDIPYFDNEPNGTIAEVVMGPRNPNLPGNVSALLMRYGHKGVRIRQSTATYR